MVPHDKKDLPVSEKTYPIFTTGGSFGQFLRNFLGASNSVAGGGNLLMQRRTLSHMLMQGTLCNLLDNVTTTQTQRVLKDKYWKRHSHTSSRPPLKFLSGNKITGSNVFAHFPGKSNGPNVFEKESLRTACR